MMTSKEAIEQVMAQEPQLTEFGFFQPRDWPPEERAAKLREMRDEMLSPRSLDEFERSCDWLRRQPRTKNVNRRVGTSYGIKHEAANEVGYIRNGIFIAAAIACGFKTERMGYNGPNAYFNISVRCYRDEQPKQKPHKADCRKESREIDPIRDAEIAALAELVMSLPC